MRMCENCAIQLSRKNVDVFVQIQTLTKANENVHSVFQPAFSMYDKAQRRIVTHNHGLLVITTQQKHKVSISQLFIVSAYTKKQHIISRL